MADSDSSWRSLARFAVALGTVGLGAAGGMAFVPVVGTYLGTLLGGFALGLVFEEGALLETSVAAVLAGVGVILASTLLGNGVVDAVVGLVSLRPQLLFVSAVLSAGTGALGAHLGNDLRDGLAEPVEGSSRRTIEQ